jgi:DNA polymerase/3'-5' exonuclease PolX
MKRDLDPELARTVAQDFLERTKDLYRRVKVAGSLRRKEPVVHDIDFAVIPKDRDFSAWKRKVEERVNDIGGKVISFGEVISNFVYRDIQVNLFLCPGDDSWGPTYMWATGPKGHTIGMTIKARNKGLLINSTGIWTRDEPPRLIPARTEEDVARILDWRFKPPEERGKAQKKERSFY